MGFVLHCQEVMEERKHVRRPAPSCGQVERLTRFLAQGGSELLDIRWRQAEGEALRNCGRREGLGHAYSMTDTGRIS